MKEKVDMILKHDITCFINRSIHIHMIQSLVCPFMCTVCRQLIYNYPEQLFADAGVMAIEHADFEGVERLSLVLGKVYLYWCTLGPIFPDESRICLRQ